MSAGWEVKTLDEFCDIKHGYAFKSKDFETDFSGENPIVLTPGNFSEGATLYFNQKNTKRCTGEFPEEYKFNKGDLVVVMTDLSSKMKILGKPAFIEEENILHNQRIGRFSFRDDALDKAYLYYYMQTPTYLNSIKETATGTMVRHTAPKRILKNKILIPKSIEEQQRIVAVLDEVLAGVATAVAHTERNLVNGRELFDSTLQSIFANPLGHWEEKTLKQISLEFGRGKSKHRPRNHPKLYGGDYPFIQTGDIRNCDHFITDYSQTYNEVGLAQSKLWPKGTICITIAANIAETGVLSFDACFPDSVIGVVVNPQLATSGFVEYLLQSFKVRLQAKGKGSAQANINMGTFKNEYFPFPPVNEQHAIVAHLDALAAETQRLQASHQQKLAALHELKQSILQQAFSGKLTK